MLRDKSTAYIDSKATIGNNVIISENVHIEGASVISENVTIYPNTFISNSIIGKGTKVYSSIIEKAVIGQCCFVGPFVHIKKGVVLGNHISIGSFSVIKNAEINDFVKIMGHSQIADVKLLQGVFVSSGVNFVGGNEKVLSCVGADAVIEAGSTIKAPCKIKSKQVISAGSLVGF